MGGILGGLGTALILRQANAIKNWISLPIIPIGFVLGIVVFFNLGNLIGYETGDSLSFLKGYAWSGVVGGAIIGLAVGLYLLMERAVSSFKSAVWICASHALGLAVGGVVINIVYGLLESQASEIVNSTVRGALTGAVAGLIAWIRSVYWMKRLER